MKKSFIFLILCLFFNGFLNSSTLNAQEPEEIEELDEITEIEKDYEEEMVRERNEVSLEWISEDDEDDDKPFRIKNRKYEFGLIDAKAGFSNNFLSVKEFFREKLIIDIDKLEDGLAVNVDLKMMPLFFNFNKNDAWGAGFSFGIDAAGIFNISGELLSFDEAVNEKSNISGALFLEARYNGFFYIEKVKIKFKPALFYPIAYIEPDITYTKKDLPEGTILNIGYKVRVYTAWQTEDSFKPTAFPGLDMILGIEYPLSEIHGYKNKNSLLDFTLGIDLINLPIVPAFMSNYMEISGKIGNDKPMDFLGDGLGGFSFNNEDMVYGLQRTPIFRPFKLVHWVEWRPFKNKPLSFIAPLGFMLSPYYYQVFSLEAGIIARLDLANLFIAAVSIGYFDRLWKNGLDLVFNFRLFELDLGVEMRSHNFTKCWSGSGFAAALGLKFGW